jgi:hypothetical protein
MSNGLVEFLKRLSNDLSFKSLAEQQPDLALAGYQMSDEERNALKGMLRSENQHSAFVRPANNWWN